MICGIVQQSQMSEQITLQLPDEIAQQARETAQQTGRSMEAILEEWLTCGAKSEAIYPLLTDIPYEVWSPYDSAGTTEDLKQLLKKESQ
jgi:hypothetical protein